MKRNYWKMILRTVWRSLNRFLAIFAITALGVGFLTGLLCTAPDMKNSVDRYYDAAHFMDINIKSTMGLTEEDVRATREIEGVRAVTPVYQKDVLMQQDSGESYAVKLLALDFSAYSEEDVNLLALTEGRLPEKEGECVQIAVGPFNPTAELGETLRMEIAEEDEELFRTTELTVVGTVTSPLYMSTEHESSTVGNGTAEFFFYVDRAEFDTDIYTDLFVQAADAEAFNTFSDAYQDRVDTQVTILEDLGKDREQARYDGLQEEANKEIGDAEKEYLEKRADAEKELADAKTELDDALQEIEDGERELADGEKELVDAKKELEDSEKQLQEAKRELDDAKKQLDDAAPQIEELRRTINENKKPIEKARKAIETYDKGVEDYEEGVKELEEARKTLDEGQKTYEQGVKDLADQREKTEAELAAAKKQLDEAAKSIEEGQRQLEAQRPFLDEATLALAEAQLEAARKEYEAGYKEYEKNKAAAEAAFAEAEKTLAESAKELEEGEKTYAESEKLLQEAKKELDASKAQIEAARKSVAEWDKNYPTMTEAIKTYEKSLAEYEKGKTSWEEGVRKYNDGLKEYEDGKVEIEENRRKLIDARKEYQDGLKEYEEAAAEAESEFADAEKELADARQEAADMDYPEWYVLDRNTNVSYVSFVSNADKVSAIAKVFPIFFFLVAALVALTTMTRMVEEERTELGVMKALGYGTFAIAAKYMLYAGSAGVLGAVAGVFLGQWLFPTVIWGAYGIMYYYPGFRTEFLARYALPSALAAIVSVLAATWWAVSESLRDCPSRLMLPKAPKQGKRIFLEHITPLWKRMKFTHKVTARNLFRYKKRFFMTIIGIAGCTALLVTGFGIRDSIGNIVTIQYEELQQYNLTVDLAKDAPEEDVQALAAFFDEKQEEYLPVHTESGTVYSETAQEDVTLETPSDSARFTDFVELRQRVNGEKVAFDDHAVILTEKLADTLKLSVGDTFTVENGDEEKAEVTVTGITENYIFGRVYMGAAAWEAAFGKRPDSRNWLVKSPAEREAEDGELREILEQPSVSSAQFNSTVITTFENMLSKIDYIVIVLILCAGLLAFVVLYNLTNINISERQKEIATIKVLGFYHSEVNAYIFRETILLSLFGALAGLAGGFFLHRFVVVTVEVSDIMFGRRILPLSYLYSACLTMFFTFLVSLAMSRRLRAISMVESMKSVD